MSGAQLDFIRSANGQGYLAEVRYGAGEAAALLEWYLSGERQ